MTMLKIWGYFRIRGELYRAKTGQIQGRLMDVLIWTGSPYAMLGLSDWLGRGGSGKFMAAVLMRTDPPYGMVGYRIGATGQDV